MREWRYSDRTGSARALLGGGSRGRSRKGGSRQDASFLRRNWRASAGVAGLLMFSMALAGLVAIFSTIQRGRTPNQGTDLEEIKEIKDVRTPAARSEIIPPETCERRNGYHLVSLARLLCRLHMTLSATPLSPWCMPLSGKATYGWMRVASFANGCTSTALCRAS